MRVVLDARMAASTGIGRYVRRLVEHLPAAGGADFEMLVAVNPGDPMAWLPDTEQIRPVCFERRIGAFSLREMTGLGKALLRWKPDVIHAPNWNAPTGLDVPVVVTLHDLIYYHFAGSCPSRLAHWYARWALPRVARSADYLISVSQATKDDAVRSLGVAEERVTVVHHGLPLDPAASAPVAPLPEGVTEPFVLYVGTCAPHKNLPLLIHAVSQVNARGEKLQLVIAGPPGRHGETLDQAIRSHSAGEFVVRAGRVEDDVLRGLYAKAACLALPSKMEGFGFTPLEAFAYGCPVVAADIAPVREVGADATLRVAPDDSPGWSDALRKIRDDAGLREQLITKGKERLTAFSWQRAAEETAAVYRLAAGIAESPAPATGADPTLACG
jgi:glycosyltransferase involved in cell wall biosynthesis